MGLARPRLRSLLLASSLAFALALAGASGARASEPLPAGKSQFRFQTRGKTLEVYTYRPAGHRGGPLFIVMHGMDRNPDTYRDRAVVLADRHRALLVAPGFDEAQFPNDAYHRGGILAEQRAQPPTNWTYQYIAELVREVRRREGRKDLPVYLIGHSAGGQFLNRLAAFMPGDAVRIVAANPGTLIFPTRDLPFPFGFGELPETLGGEAALRRYLAAPLTLFLGAEDTGYEHLDRTRHAMRQGPDRISRGRACFELGARLARQRGWPFNWRLVEAPGVGHSSKRMFAHPAAAEALFGPAGP